MPNNMSKKTIIIIGFILSVTGWQLTTHSQETAESVHTAACSNDQCCITYREGLDALELDWARNLELLKDQPRSTSSMVDEAFENLRTYRCWAEYVCSAVLYSGLNSFKTVIRVDGSSSGITSDHIATLPGCQPPEDIDLEAAWNDYIDIQKALPIFGDISEIYATSKFNFIPQCITSSDNREPRGIQRAAENYGSCLTEVESRFNCDEDDSANECASKKLSLIQVTTALQKNSANQKGAALENKLVSILSKLNGMESHLDYLKVKLSVLGQRYACAPPDCD